MPASRNNKGVKQVSLHFLPICGVQPNLGMVSLSHEKETHPAQRWPINQSCFLCSSLKTASTQNSSIIQKPICKFVHELHTDGSNAGTFSLFLTLTCHQLSSFAVFSRAFFSSNIFESCSSLNPVSNYNTFLIIWWQR